MKKLLANQFKNDYEYEQAKKRIKKGAVEARNKRLQRDYDVSGMVYQVIAKVVMRACIIA